MSLPHRNVPFPFFLPSLPRFPLVIWTSVRLHGTSSRDSEVARAIARCDNTGTGISVGWLQVWWTLPSYLSLILKGCQPQQSFFVSGDSLTLFNVAGGPPSFFPAPLCMDLKSIPHKKNK